MAESNDKTILQAMPKIVHCNNLETILFNYQVTYDKFSTRALDVDSPSFGPPGRTDEFPTFYMKMEPNNNSYVRFTLYLKTTLKKIPIRTQTWLVDKNQEKYGKTNETFEMVQGSNRCIYACHRNYVLSSSCGLLIDDKLTFICEVDLINKYTIQFDWDEFSEKLFGKLDENGKIANDFELLLQSGDLSDVELVIGDKTLKAHKTILTARSPVFAAMFKSDFKENVTNKVEITDVDFDIFEQLLNYIYTGKIPEMDSTNTSKLLIGADKYQLESLKLICAKAMETQLCPESMFESLLIADMYNAGELQAKTIEFISNKTSTVDALKALFTRQQNSRLGDAMKELLEK